MKRRSFLTRVGAALAAAPAVVALKETCGGCGAPTKDGGCRYCGRDHGPAKPAMGQIEIVGALPGSFYVALDGWELRPSQDVLFGPARVERGVNPTFELPVDTQFLLRVRKAGWFEVEQPCVALAKGWTTVIVQRVDSWCVKRIITTSDIRRTAEGFRWPNWDIGEFIEVKIRGPNRVQVYVSGRPHADPEFVSLQPPLDLLCALEEELRKYALVTLELTVHPYAELKR